MRRALVVVAVILGSTSLLAQRPPRRPMPFSFGVQSAETAVKQAAERLANTRKAVEQNLKVLGHIRNSDNALVDPMQPGIAVQKAFEEMVEAERLNGDPVLATGLIRARQRLDEARKSPATADFGRLRAIVRDEALGPSIRLVVRTATVLQEETLAWIAVQEMIATHLKSLAEITGESLRASQQD